MKEIGMEIHQENLPATYGWLVVRLATRWIWPSRITWSGWTARCRGGLVTLNPKSNHWKSQNSHPPKTKRLQHGHDMDMIWATERGQERNAQVYIEAFFWHVTNTLLSQRSSAACTGRPFKPQWYISRLIEPIAGDDSKRGDCTDFCTNLIPCPHLLKVYQMPLGRFSNVFELGPLSLSSKTPCNTWL